MIDPLGGEPRDLDEGRQISFAVTPTGVRVAYATVGRGPALVVPAAWIGHLEIGWQDPAMRAFYAPIAACRTVVAYDKPGCGLSDPWPAPQTLDSDLEVLRAVTDHLRLGRVDLLGLSMGAGVVGHAVPAPRGGRTPDAVRRLRQRAPGRLGQGPHGHDRTGPGALGARFGRAGRHLPPRRQSGDEGTLRRAPTPVHDRRRGCSELLAQCYEIRVDDLLDRVAAPTLVLHRRDDRAIPYRLGRDLAARIPGARLVSLAGRSHWVYAGDAAAVVREILGFLGASHGALPAKQAERSPDTLTPRQLQVAALVADGLTNRQIAGRLGIEERSAEGHVERIRQRLGVRSRAQIATWWASGHGN
jgi:pimeloyl-ACP methyl ester carboxylesterase